MVLLCLKTFSYPCSCSYSSSCFFTLLLRTGLPAAGSVAVVIYFLSWQPFLHIQFREGDESACFCYLEDVCILIARLPLHVFSRNGGKGLVSVDDGADGVSALLVLGDVEWWHIIPLVILVFVLQQMNGIALFLVRYRQAEESCGTCFRRRFPRKRRCIAGWGFYSCKGIGSRDGSLERGIGRRWILDVSAVTKLDIGDGDALGVRRIGELESYLGDERRKTEGYALAVRGSGVCIVGKP